jgi:hypothetical protein
MTAHSEDAATTVHEFRESCQFGISHVVDATLKDALQPDKS